MIKSFINAWRGLKTIVRGRSFIWALVAGIGVIAVTWLFKEFTLSERLTVIVFVVLVLSLEAMNTAVEKLSDIVNPTHSDRIKIVKDISAGAVLIAITGAFIAWLIIVWDVFNRWYLLNAV